MDRRRFLLTAMAALATPVVAEAQAPGRAVRRRS
jgi:hypothetical protein